MAVVWADWSTNSVDGAEVSSHGWALNLHVACYLAPEGLRRIVGCQVVNVCPYFSIFSNQIQAPADPPTKFSPMHLDTHITCMLTRVPCEGSFVSTCKCCTVACLRFRRSVWFYVVLIDQENLWLEQSLCSAKDMSWRLWDVNTTTELLLQDGGTWRNWIRMHFSTCSRS